MVDFVHRPANFGGTEEGSMNARFILNGIMAFALASATLVILPGVAHATRVTIIRLDAVDGDEQTAAELTAALNDVGEDMPGWTVNTATGSMADLMAASGCESAVTPSLECLIHMANTSGSGAYGAMLIFGTVRRSGEGSFEIEIGLFDAVEASITRSVHVTVTAAQLANATERRRLVTEWIIRLGGPSGAAAPARTLVILGPNSVEGDDLFTRELSLVLRQAAIEANWSVDERLSSQEQMLLSGGCDAMDTACAATIRGLFGNPDAILGGTTRRSDGNFAVTIDFFRFDPAEHRFVTGELPQHYSQTDIIALARQLVSGMESAPIADERPAPTEPPLVASGSTSGFDLEYVAWPLIGLAGVSLVMEIVSWAMIGGVQSDPDFMALRTSYGSGTGNVCTQAPTGTPVDARAHGLCNTAGDWENVEIAFGVIGGAALAGGLTALVLDLMGGHPPDEHAFLIRPVFSSTRAGLDLAWRF
jgi:hypothetical protein